MQTARERRIVRQNLCRCVRNYRSSARAAARIRAFALYNPRAFRMPKKPDSERRADFVTSLDRGLRVLQTFSREHSQLTLSEVAALTDLSPATARRSLHTLEYLGCCARRCSASAPDT
jgi:Fic family protein